MSTQTHQRNKTPSLALRLDFWVSPRSWQRSSHRVEKIPWLENHARTHKHTYKQVHNNARLEKKTGKNKTLPTTDDFTSNSSNSPRQNAIACDKKRSLNISLSLSLSLSLSFLSHCVSLCAHSTHRPVVQCRLSTLELWFFL